ncbi:helix-turn-helix transcriptional regulator [Schlegelella sp. ID0723]|uniref:Helix-turn-helix transcriptional regulator n=2 Tax=Piscinibacter koreensis TaxID=2742824 RepID=A0A7Y6TWB8_9BURK|nr:helix-turn-helix transcriptional regulator [Schlegelella koreensis]
MLDTELTDALPELATRRGEAERRLPPHRGSLDAALLAHALVAVLDEIDYGIVLLVDGGARIATINHAARSALDDHHPLLIARGALEARSPADLALLRQAVDEAARQNRRRLLTLGSGAHRSSMAVVPVALGDAEAPAVLVVLGKRAVCEPLSINGFCRSHGITGAETRVLMALAGGVAPKQIARQLGVALSTIRTHIISLRAKTGAASIGALLTRVACLPPLRCVLRGSCGAPSGPHE